MKGKKIKIAGVLVLSTMLAITSLAACGTKTKSTSTGSSSSSTSVSTSDMFTKRDLDSSYDESKATKVKLSDSKTTVSGDGAKYSSENGVNTVTITKEGTYILSGNLNGQIVVDTDKTAKVQIVLNGVTISSESTAAIQVKQADKVFLTLAKGSENTLTETGEFASDASSTVDGVIFSKDDLTINGTGTLKISTASGHGVVSKDDLVIASGTIDITSSGHGLQGKDSVRIADGTITINSSNDGIHSENKDDSSLGFVYIKDGTIKITAADDGIHSGNNVTIDGGTITVTESSEGIEGQNIDINGGKIDVTSSDDGLNAASSSSSSDTSTQGFGGPGGGPGGGGDMSVDKNAYIKITGGEIYISAEGDGVDSNGNFEVTGGTLYVEGPSRGGNAALDFTGTGTISGGVVIATDNGSMLQSLTAKSGMNTVVLNVSSSSASEIVVKDSSGNVLGTLKPSKSFNNIIVSGAGVSESTISYN